MSKKRKIGLDKWHLRKLERDYLNHKKNKKGLSYLEEPGIKHKSKSKFPCKKLKGEHNFVLFKQHALLISDEILEYYKCTGCGKIKYECKNSSVGQSSCFVNNRS